MFGKVLRIIYITNLLSCCYATSIGTPTPKISNQNLKVAKATVTVNLDIRPPELLPHKGCFERARRSREELTRIHRGKNPGTNPNYEKPTTPEEPRSDVKQMDFEIEKKRKEPLGTLIEISSTCKTVESIIRSSENSFTPETFQTEEQKKIAISLLGQFRIQKPEGKTRLAQLITSIGLPEETHDQFNISLRALDTCSPVSLEKYYKYFTNENLKDYAIVLNILHAEEALLGRKLLTHSIGNVIGHLNSTIEYIESCGEKYDQILMNSFKYLSEQFPVSEEELEF